MSDDIERIRDRWQVHAHPRHGYRSAMTIGHVGDLSVMIAPTRGFCSAGEDTVKVVQNAPEDIAYLLSIIDDLRKRST